MPSTLVHVAVAGLVGSALLGRFFDRRAILLVMGVAAIPDLDTLLGLWIPGVHRAALHSVVVPTLLAALLVWDVYGREDSLVVDRWGAYGLRVAWVSLFAVVVAHSLYDGVVNGVNLLWPIHDRFYDFSGEFLVSTERGIIQTFIELGPAGGTVEGTTANTHYYTGVDPTRGAEPENVERIFYVIQSGERLLLTVVGFAVVGYRVATQAESVDSE